MIGAESGPKHSLATQSSGSPRESDARVNVAVGWLSETGANATETSGAAGIEVKRIGPAMNFMKDVEETIARTQIQRESRRPFELILDVAVIGRLAQSIHRQCL